MVAVERLLERVLTKGGGELLRTMLLIGERPSLYGIMSKQVSDESSPFSIDLGLAD